MRSFVTGNGMHVLILGATGVFGSRLVERLAREKGFSLILAARSKAKLLALAQGYAAAAEIRQIDRARIVPTDLANVDVVIDVAGPFQGSHVQVIEAALAAGVHYIDLADGRAFVAAISRFDAAARGAGIAVVSGASSTLLRTKNDMVGNIITDNPPPEKRLLEY